MLATRARLAGYTLLAPASLGKCGTLETSNNFAVADDFDSETELSFDDSFSHFECHFHFSFLLAFYTYIVRLPCHSPYLVTRQKVFFIEIFKSLPCKHLGKRKVFICFILFWHTLIDTA